MSLDSKLSFHLPRLTNCLSEGRLPALSWGLENVIGCWGVSLFSYKLPRAGTGGGKSVNLS